MFCGGLFTSKNENPMKKNDCYDCPYREKLSHSAHSKCNTISEGALAIAFSIKVASGEVTGIGSDKGQLLKFDPHGVANGWCAWPVNFDPVWVECRLPIKQETKSRYDWDRFPKWVKWIATDPDGRVWGYSTKPEFDKSISVWCSVMAYRFFELGDPTDWENSLEERPKNQSNG